MNNAKPALCDGLLVEQKPIIGQGLPQSDFAGHGS